MSIRIVKRRASCSGCRGLIGRKETSNERCAYGFATGYRDVETPIPITRSGKISVLFPLEPCPRPGRNFDGHIEAGIYEMGHRAERRAAREAIYEAEAKREGQEAKDRMSRRGRDA